MGFSVWMIQRVRSSYPVLIWVSLALVALVHVLGQYSVQSIRPIDVPIYSPGEYQTELQEKLSRPGAFKSSILN